MTSSGPAAPTPRQPSSFDLWVLAHRPVAYAVGALMVIGALVLGVTLRTNGVDGLVSYVDIVLGALGIVVALWPRNVERLVRYNEALTAEQPED